MKKILPLIALAGVFLIFAGCAAPSRLVMDYGTSYNLAKFNQVLYPAAEKNLEPVAQFDGVAGQIVIERYWKGFEKATPTAPYGPIFGIRGITTGMGSGQQ
jgi:hypothetical protein